jgi:hypothetical protein
MGGLALNNDQDIDYPYTSRDSHDDLIFVPNGDAGSLDERFAGKHGPGLEG